MGGGGRDAPFLAPHPAKISLHPCGVIGDGEGMHGTGIRGNSIQFLIYPNHTHEDHTPDQNL
jgi:hypothetical protein